MILASQSPRRRELLEEAGFSLRVLPADINEARMPDEKPEPLVRRLAQQKAEATRLLLEGHTDDDVLVAADTIVWTDEGNVLGKPVDEEDAVRMLESLSGKVHHVSSGACVMHLSPTADVIMATSFVETTDVEFYPLTNKEIRAYAASGEPLDKAGAYGIQGRGGLLVRGIRGDYFNVVGLPVARLVREVDRMIGPGVVVGTLGRQHGRH